MKRLSTIILCCLMTTIVGAGAQRDLQLIKGICNPRAYTQDQKLERINAIKKSSDYLYADVTMPTLENAASQAYEQLQREVYGWMDPEKLSAVEINSMADTIITQRANMFRVFAYASKSELQSAVEPDSCVCPQTEEATVQEDLRSREFAIPACPAQSCDSTNTSVGVDSIPKQSLPYHNLTRYFGATSSTQGDAFHDDTPSERFGSTPHRPVVAGDTIRQLLMHNFLGRKGEVIEQLKKARTFFELRQIMEPLKAKGDILDYGKYATAKKPEDCFLIVYDPAGNIRALLGKGKEGTRSNMITGKADGIANYRGCGAIWFKLSE